MNAFLDIFSANVTARALFLFDCVDPIRHMLTAHGISYQFRPARPASRPRAFLMPVRRFAHRSLFATRLALGLYSAPSRKLPGEGMGYGYLPRFWINAAAARQLQIEIVSSRVYEYRYHVILRKSDE